MSKNYVSIRIRRNDFKKITTTKEIQLFDKSTGRKKTITVKRTYNSVQQQLEHDIRIEDIKYLRDNPNYQIINYNGMEKETKDKSLINGNHDKFFKQKWEESKKKYKEKNGRGVHSKTKPFLTGIITFTEVKNEDIPKMNEIVNKFLKKKFGNSLMYLVLHLDEKTPHYHFTVLNYDEDLNKSFSNNIDTSLLQTEIAEELKELGYDRGEPKEETNAIHEEIVESHLIEYEKKEKEFKEKEISIENKEKISNEKIQKNYNEKLEDLNDKKNQINLKQRELKQREIKLEEKEMSLREQMKLIVNRENDLNTQRNDLKELERNIKDQKIIKRIDIYLNRLLEGRKSNDLKKIAENRKLVEDNLKKLSKQHQKPVRNVIDNNEYYQFGL